MSPKKVCLALVFLAGLTVLGIGYSVKTFGVTFTDSFIGVFVDEKLETPKGIFFDNQYKELYVCDQGQNKVLIFNEQGFLIFNFKVSVSSPVNIVVTSSREIIVNALNDNCLYVYSYRGVFIRTIPLEGIQPQKIAIAPDDTILILNSSDNSIVFMDSVTGTIKRKISDPELLKNPNGLYVDQNSNIYVSDYTKKKVYVFDRFGGLKLSFGRSGTVDGAFSIIGDVCVDRDGNIYVIDRTKSRIHVFDKKGIFKFAFPVPDVYNIAISDKRMYFSSGKFSSLLIYDLI